MASANSGVNLRRELGVFDATMMGMGSIVGTGVFVSIGIAAGITGPSVVLATALAAVVATCNAFSSAQLAASHPVSGGTYEYGYTYLNPALGFTAGWMFLCAKTASAATASLGFAGYLLHAIHGDTVWLTPLAVSAALILTLLVLTGIRRSSTANIAIVSITLGSLALFVVAGVPEAIRSGTANLAPFFHSASAESHSRAAGFFHATALMFVAYTGYGRIATLGEEVYDPRRTIPRAIVATLIISALLYVSVAVVAIGSAGVELLYNATAGRAAPLEVVAQTFRLAWVRWIVAFGAVTAMLGVLLNLILGLSRVLLAMGRRRDVPALFGRLNAAQTTPVPAVIAVGIAIAGLAAIGSVKTTWSFSAFTVLIYYAITNLAALQLAPEQRLYSRVFPWGGLVACMFLAFWVEWEIWLTGLGLIGAGLLWHSVARTFRPS